MARFLVGNWLTWWMLNLRAVSPDERPALYEMARAYWQELMPRSPVVQDTVRRSQYFDRQFRLDTGFRQYWVFLDGERIGFVNVEIRDNATGQRWGDIRDFYIGPAWRRRGHGRVCARRIIEWLRGEQAAGVDLHCRIDNPAALAFWQAVGFEIVSYRLRQHLA